MWKLTLNAPAQSGNVVLRMHWRTYNKTLAKWYWLVRGAAGFVGVPKASGKRRLTVQIHGKRAMDFENRVFACKALVDILRPFKREAGIYASGKKKGQPWTRERIGHGLVIDDDDTHLDLNVPPVMKLLPGQTPFITLTLEDV